MQKLNDIIHEWPRQADFVEKVKAFIENGGDPNEAGIWGDTALMDVHRVKPVALYLVNHGAMVNVMNKRGRSPLHYAAHESDAAFAKFLLANGADPNICNEDIGGETPLMTACLKFEDFNPVAELLVQYGADVNRRDKGGSTALHVSVRSNNYSLYEFLLKNGADATIKNINGKTAEDYWEDEDESDDEADIED